MIPSCEVMSYIALEHIYYFHLCLSNVNKIILHGGVFYIQRLDRIKEGKKKEFLALLSGQA